MVWPLIAMGAMSMLGSAMGNNAAAKTSKGENKAVREANLKNFQQNAFRVGMLNVQRAQDKKALDQKKFDLGADELSALGSSQVNAAASGTVGASVGAVQTDIQLQYDKQRALISEENEESAMNFNTTLYDLVTNGQNSMKSAHKPQTQSSMSMLAGAAIDAGSKYASARMDLGLGQGGGPSGAMRA